MGKTDNTLKIPKDLSVDTLYFVVESAINATGLPIEERVRYRKLFLMGMSTAVDQIEGMSPSDVDAFSEAVRESFDEYEGGNEKSVYLESFEDMLMERFPEEPDA